MLATPPHPKKAVKKMAARLNEEAVTSAKGLRAACQSTEGSNEGLNRSGFVGGCFV